MLSYFLGFLISLSVVVFVHELGHYWFAVMSGVAVDEFSIGFGKPLFSRKDKKGTVWKIGSIPFGGYVKMAGEDSKSSSGDGKNFQNQSNFTKIRILLAGPLANYMLAFVLFFIVYFFLGNVGSGVVVVDMDNHNKSLKESGIAMNDVILKLNGKEISSLEDFMDAGKKITKENVTVEYSRKGDVHVAKIVPMMNVNGDYRIGIVGAFSDSQKTGFLDSVHASLKNIWHISVESAKGIFGIILGKRSIKELSGPLKIAKYSGVALKQGVVVFLNFIAFLSISLGFMNLLPIPMLDGGQVVIYFIEILYRKRLPEMFYSIAEKVSIAMLGFLMIFVLLNDAISIFR